MQYDLAQYLFNINSIVQDIPLTTASLFSMLTYMWISPIMVRFIFGCNNFQFAYPQDTERLWDINELYKLPTSTN